MDICVCVETYVCVIPSLWGYTLCSGGSLHWVNKTLILMAMWPRIRPDCGEITTLRPMAEFVCSDSQNQNGDIEKYSNWALEIYPYKLITVIRLKAIWIIMWQISILMFLTVIQLNLILCHNIDTKHKMMCCKCCVGKITRNNYFCTVEWDCRGQSQKHL